MNYFDSDELKRFSQQTADAISAVLHMNVTVVDQDVKRVAGTGCFAESVLQVLPTSYVFTRVIFTGQVCLIEDPGKSIYCASCTERGQCREKATLMVPVLLAEKVIGAIGLIAMTDRDKEILLAKSGDFTNFMVKMAELLAAKVRSELAISEMMLLNKRLEAVADALTDGVISIDNENRVTHFNHPAALLLRLAQHNVIGRDYREIIYCRLFDDGLKTQMNVENIKTAIVAGGVEYPMLISMRTILYEGKIGGIVVFFQEISNTKKKYEQVLMSNARHSFENIWGDSPEIRHCIDMAKRVSASNSSVLILGESGTGKELFARAIHYASSRRNNNFVAINCSAIPDTLLESELFGYAGGAFTGAKKEGHRGKFEAASGGTIFLDEIGDMPLNLQAKILRVLQERTVERVGSSVSTPIDVRVLAATNRDLEQMIRDHLFRQDLYYRINVIPIKIPPLRCRKSDIAAISKALLNKYALLLGKNIEGISPEVMELLAQWSWPGNIRELENVIEYAINMEVGRMLTKSSLPPYLIEANIQTEQLPKAEDAADSAASSAPAAFAVSGMPARAAGKNGAEETGGTGEADGGGRTASAAAGASGAAADVRDTCGRSDAAADEREAPQSLHGHPGAGRTLKDIYRESRREQILCALAQFENSTQGKRQCAESLHISLSTLYRKMKELNIDTRRR